MKTRPALINHGKFFKCHNLSIHNVWSTVKHFCRFLPFSYEYDVNIAFFDIYES
jgi:hypothetical protein